ncbi:MAG: PspC domain-containing protein [bacterium]|nr:PspC domain-containing protein [bacterium]
MTSEETKKLYRSVSKRMIGGVCAGLADYMNADANVVRIIVTILTLATGVAPGVITYFVAWIILPEKD